MLWIFVYGEYLARRRNSITGTPLLAFGHQSGSIYRRSTHQSAGKSNFFKRGDFWILQTSNNFFGKSWRDLRRLLYRLPPQIRRGPRTLKCLVWIVGVYVVLVNFVRSFY